MPQHKARSLGFSASVQRNRVVLSGSESARGQYLGPGAMSLGTTAVERTWWPDHVRNTNKTARWATEAWRQYRAVVAWKHDVATVLRKTDEPLRKGRSGSKFLHSVEKTLAMLQSEAREPLRLGV